MQKESNVEKKAKKEQTEKAWFLQAFFYGLT